MTPELLELVAIIPLAGTVVSLMSDIVDIVNQVKVNQKQSMVLIKRIQGMRRLSLTLSGLTPALESLTENKDSQEIAVPLKHLEELLNEIRVFLKHFMGASWFQKVLKNGTFGREFEDYSQKISDCQREFMFGNSIMMTTILTTMAANMESLRLELNQARLNDANSLQKKQKEIARSASMGNSVAMGKIELEFSALMNKEMKEIIGGGDQLEVQVINKLPLLHKSDLKIKGELGRGAYGIVSSAIWRGEMVAIKSLGDETSTLTPKNKSDLKKEAATMFQLNHPSIIKLLAAVYEENDLMLVMEIAEKGSLKEAIEENVLDNSFIWFVSSS
jgi:hypothetical protein